MDYINYEALPPISVDKYEAKQYFTKLGLAVLVLRVVTTALQYAFSYLFYYLAPNIYNAWWFIWALSLLPLYLVAFPLFYKTLPKPIKKPDARKPYGAGRLTVTCIISMTTMMIVNYAAFYLVEFIRYASGGKLGGMDVLNEAVNASPIWVTAICTCVLAPILEEIVFRKLIIDRVKPFGELRACLVSALIFGLFHGNLRQFMYAAAIGFIFSYVYVKTNNIVYSIAMHAGINLLGSVIIPNILSNKNLDTVMRIAEDPASMTNEDAIVVLLMFAVIFGGIAVLVGGLVLLCIFARKIKFEKGEYTVDGGKVSSAIYNNIGMIAAIAVMTATVIVALIS